MKSLIELCKEHGKNARKPEGLYDPSFEHDSCGVGFISTLNKIPNHDVMSKAMTILQNLVHRGAVGGDKKTGDGAGLLFQIPHEFFNKKSGLKLPADNKYGVGMFFMPQDDDLRKKAKELIEACADDENIDIIGWRDVPTDNSFLGEIALASEPVVQQIFINQGDLDTETFERKLYIFRRVCEKRVWEELDTDFNEFYICTLSAKLICYKGLLVGFELSQYYPDLSDESLKSLFCVIHQRYSTNTFPIWPLAHPFRLGAHNGEINTLRGNVNRMKSRETSMSSKLFGDDLKKLFPVIIPNASDSHQFDNVLELLLNAGRTLPHSMMMMVPEAFGNKYHMSEDKRAFYEFHATFMEPWDGPAALVCTDGRLICGMLDRNGLRPCRYTITKDGYIILASEVGVVDIKPDNIEKESRLQPGTMLLVDTAEGRIISDKDIKSRIVRQNPYRRWLDKNRIELRGLFGVPEAVEHHKDTLLQRQKTFGYSVEDLKYIIAPMAEYGQEPVGSMGTDTPLAVLSQKPKLFYEYFKQLFAQVTNPPIDPLRETLVMSLMSYIGKEANFLEDTPDHCKQLKLPHPILSNEDMQKIKSSDNTDIPCQVIDALFDPKSGGKGLEDALANIFKQAQQAIDDGKTLIVLSDKGVNKERAAIPMLLALSGLHQYLTKIGYRKRAGLIVESGEIREIMHFALLIGFGASAVNPYLVFESITDMHLSGLIKTDLDTEELLDNYFNAVKKGLLKTLSRMGISTIRSYRGAQIFSAVGLSQQVINKYFSGCISQVGGIGLEEIAKEAIIRHKEAFYPENDEAEFLNIGGEYQYIVGGQPHVWTPTTISNLQQACRTNNKNVYKKFADEVNNRKDNPIKLRDLLDFKKTEPISLSEVEPIENIIKRFYAGAMSFGALSKEAHETIAIAMNRLGAGSNTGEGGEDSKRYKPLPNGDSLCSKVKQVASGRFGVTSNYLVNSEEIQIKMAQGAKPGEGGQLPGHKVNEIIAKVRYSTPGVSLISPPPHHDIYSIEDLAQLIFDLRNVNPNARISVKLVSEPGVGTVAAGVAKAKADMVLISGYDGGTGASPLTSIKHAGLPVELGIAETHQTLVKNKLRDVIRVQADGQMLTGRDIIMLALLGAEEFGFATAPLVVLGCCLLRKCQLNSCAMGVATQDPELRCRFRGQPEYLENYFRFIAEEVREIMASLGIKKLNDLIGRTDLIEKRKDIEHWKAKYLDYSKMLHKVKIDPDRNVYCEGGIQNPLDKVLDNELIELSKSAIEKKEKVVINKKIRNYNRATGALLSGEISKHYGEEGLPAETITCNFTGSAGQSFGAFLSRGVTLKIEGNANDYLGKGMSGGKIIVVPPKDITFNPSKNVIVGNTILFGATGGEVYINGAAGERFCVRNSGAKVVVESVGDHGCEYMTGGVAVVLGNTGINFAAGMSGGFAFVYDENQLFDTRCNLDMVDLYPITEEADITLLKSLIQNHADFTASERAKEILKNWTEYLPQFIKVLPIDYKLALERIKELEERSSDRISATEEVY